MDEKSKEICFRVEPETHDKLLSIADEEGLSLPELISNIAATHAERRARLQSESEKREFIRNQIKLPAVLQLRFEPGETHYRTGTIIDISMGGVRISLPKHERLDVEVFERCQNVEILFRLPGEEFTITFGCKPSRVHSLEDDIEMGAVFTEADLRSQQILHKYVM